LPVGISVAVAYPAEVINGIGTLPTQEYSNWYDTLNTRLEDIVILGEAKLTDLGYIAYAQTAERVNATRDGDKTLLPKKTVATRAGLGWIGRSALLTTAEYGSMIRLSSILTDAPLITAEPVNKSKCGDCMACVNACPGGAVTGKLWTVGIAREEIFDADKCSRIAKERSKLGFGTERTLCGKCIEVCPYTRSRMKQGVEAGGI
jgi:epoxyqueuosine reductase QueG